MTEEKLEREFPQTFYLAKSLGFIVVTHLKEQSLRKDLTEQYVISSKNHLSKDLDANWVDEKPKVLWTKVKFILHQKSHPEKHRKSNRNEVHNNHIDV